MTRYVYQTKPFGHQVAELRRSYLRPAWAYLMEMGTGKTKIVLDECAALYERGHVDLLVVCAPKSVYTNWLKEIEIHLPGRIARNIVLWGGGGGRRRGEALLSLQEQTGHGKVLDVFLLNIEALSHKKGQQALQLVMSGRNAYWVIDESAFIKKRTATRTKVVINLRTMAKYRRILNGTPITKGPLDLFTQCVFLDPELLGYSNYYVFQNRYAKVVRRDLGGGRRFNQIVGYQNLDELRAKLKVFSSIVKKSDCLDLPPKLYETIEIELSPEQKQAYNTLAEEAMVMFDMGECTVTMTLTMLLRFQQIVCGFLPLDKNPDEKSGRVQLLPSERVPTLLSLLDSVHQKALIYAPFIRSILELQEEIGKKYGKESVATFYGKVKTKDRAKIIEEFQRPESPLKFLIGNKALAYGWTLTQATTVIYFANTYDLDVRQQSEDRAHRIGQDNKVTYLDLVARGTVDEKILTALLDKREIARVILGDEIREWIKPL